MAIQGENLKYHTGWRRAAAAIVDALILGISFEVIYWLVTNYNHSGGYVDENYRWTLFLSVSSIAYSVLMHWRYGQTVGKMIAGIKVIDKSETKNITLLQAVLRDIFYILTETALLIIIGSYVMHESTDVFQETVYLQKVQQAAYWQQLNDNIGFAWAIIELVTMLSNTKRMALHDYIAGTVVVRIAPAPNATITLEK